MTPPPPPPTTTILVMLVVVCQLFVIPNSSSRYFVVVQAQDNDEFVAPLWWHRKRIKNVTGLDNVGGRGWADSYSYRGTHCYCASSFDHNIGDVMVRTPLGRLSVKTVCDLLGPGPGSAGRPLYNDIQCGNGPPNDAGDEVPCPGRVEHGKDGCKSIGPKWNFTNVSLTKFLTIKNSQQ